MARKTTKDYAAMLTKTVIEAVENGAELPWRKTWNESTRPQNGVSGHAYTGVNVLVALTAQMVGGFDSPFWVTKNQASKKLGTWFRKGESPAWFWRPRLITRTREVDGKEEKYRVCVGFSVYPMWNIDQLKDFDRSLLWGDFEENDNDPLATCERIVEGYPKPPGRRRGKPSYVPKLDTVYMPGLADFESSETFYATLFHELAHSTGHEKRLGRDGVMNINRFGSESYSREELVAEIASAMLCGEAGISLPTLDNQAAYTRHWLKRLGDDPEALAIAAGAAQKAVDHILNN